MNQHCTLSIPGLDFNLCAHCGYVPRKHEIDRIDREFDKATSEKRKAELQVEKSNLIKRMKACGINSR